MLYEYIQETFVTNSYASDILLPDKHSEQSHASTEPR